MVSYGPDTQSLNYSYMYNFVKRNNDVSTTAKTSSLCVEPGTIYDFLYTSRNFSKFLSIVDKARFSDQLNSNQADFTLFCPTDDSLRDLPADFFKDMDVGMARQIVYSSLMNRRIDLELLFSSPVSYYMTMNPRMRLFVTNIGGKTLLNETAYITLPNKQCTNGIIHGTNGLLMPTNQTFLN